MHCLHQYQKKSFCNEISLRSGADIVRSGAACRIFVGDLGNEVNDDVLQKSFQKFTSFVKGKVVRDKRTNKTKGECKYKATICNPPKVVTAAVLGSDCCRAARAGRAV